MGGVVGRFACGGAPGRRWVSILRPSQEPSCFFLICLPSFDDLTLWGNAERRPARLLFPADIPRLDKPLPRALPPDADRDLMAAISELAGPFARTGLTVLRGTGIRLGELLNLELDCIWDSASHGSWLKVPSASSPPSGPFRSTSPPSQAWTNG